MNNKWTVKYYATRRSDELVKQFIDRQDKAARAKIFRMISLLTVYGPDLGMPYARNLGHGLFELRVRGKNEIRIFYVFVADDRTAVLLHGFKKRTQKLPSGELDIARSRQKELT